MTSEELYGVLSYAKITPEQKKRRRACFVKRFEPLLKPEGFIRKGADFIRLCDDYILQVVTFRHIPESGFCEIAAEANLLLRSWRFVLNSLPDDPPRWLHMHWCSAGPTLEKLCEFRYPNADYCGQSVFRLMNDFEDAIEKSCQLMQERGIPILNQLSNLDAVAKDDHRRVELSIRSTNEKYGSNHRVPEPWEMLTPVGVLMRGDNDTALRILREFARAIKEHYDEYSFESDLRELELVQHAIERIEANDREWIDRFVNDTVEYICRHLNRVSPKILETYRQNNGRI